VVQGRKRALIGSETYHYDAFNHLLVSVTLPMKGQIIEATPERPYLCLRLGIDIGAVAKLLTEVKLDIPTADNDKPLYVARTSPDLIEVFLRLIRLLDSPSDLAVLAPLALREIWYRLLRGEMGSRLRGLVETDGQVQRISRAIEHLQRHYNQPLRIEDLADASHMSTSTFHARFKAVTTLSPLQFQKQLRLHEARRLLLTENIDAGTAAHQVGYESPSQFNREYRRFFGAPPRREIAKLRAG
jgi:AraC-like DNA-binding protein